MAQGVEEIRVSDAYEKLKEKIQKLQVILAALTQERDDLRYHICPELEARYAREIGDYENRISYQKIMILEMKRRIEIARAALNREKTITQKEMEEKVQREYGTFHEKVDEAFKRAQKAQKDEEERARREKEYERQWQKQYGNADETGAGDANRNAGGKGDGAGGKRADSEEREYRRGGAGGSGEEQNTGSGSTKKKKSPDARDLYRRIVKKLHPDVNPDITEHEKELFYRAAKAYEDGDVVTLQRIWDEVSGTGGGSEAFKKELSYEELLSFCEKLKDRIAGIRDEIKEIKRAFPYREKALLDDQAALKKLQDELNGVIHENEKTLVRLTKLLEDLTKEMEELGRKKGAPKGSRW